MPQWNCRCAEQIETAQTNRNADRPEIGYAPTVVQQAHYDPWGVKLPMFSTNGFDKYKGSPEDRFKYNGKEQQPDIGYYDYGARMYDPTIGRWFGVDLLSEMYFSYSTYAYVLNNPINLIDPNGMEVNEHYEGSEAQEKFRELKDKTKKREDDKPKVQTEEQRLSEIVTINGNKYHKNTGNIFASVGNKINSFFGGDSDYFVEHKPYDPIEDNALHETVNTGIGFLLGGVVLKVAGKAIGTIIGESSELSAAPLYSVVKESASKYSINFNKGSATEFYKTLNPAWNGTFAYTKDVFSTTSFTTQSGVKVIFNTTSNSTEQASVKIISKEVQYLFRFPNL